MATTSDSPASDSVDPPKATLTLAFCALGVLVGTLLSFSAQSLAQAVLAAVFAFFGGSILQILATRTRPFQVAAALATLSLSLGTLFGIYSGVYVNEHQLLSPANRVKTGTIVGQAETADNRKYLRENLLGLTQKKLYIQQQNVVSHYNWHPLPHEYT